MYKIIGADGKEYGPVSTEQLRKWLGEGRVNLQTKVQAEGSADWQPLGALPEFASALSKAPAAPPPLPASSPAPARTSSMAIWSLVLGILGFLCGLPALAGLILGFVSMGKIKRSNGALGGEGIALAGTIVSGVCLLLSLIMIPIMAGMLLPALAKAKERAQIINCVNNVKQLCLAAIIYANDHDGALPPAATWCDAMQSNAGSARVFQCSCGDRDSRSHYAFNARLAEMKMEKITDAATTVLFFETDGGWNVSGGPEMMLKSPRHGRAIVVGFADGHIESVSNSRLNDLRWDP